ncbi:hypothetical protein [Streptomyces decoyicus]|uniref:hypothetical protein n=1 Tax=Streptomyces decoyicus TaxID=249567 RepID=UPI00380607CE
MARPARDETAARAPAAPHRPGKITKIEDSKVGQLRARGSRRKWRMRQELVLAPVRLAQQRGYLRGWRGDVGVDATAIPVLADPDRERAGTASVEITAGWHYSAGADEGAFGYSASFVVAAHRRRLGEGTGKPLAYPQLCVGLVLDTPTVRVGRNAVTALTQLAELGFPAGTCAADRAYTGCAPENFQIPVRRLGYRLALDYKAENRGKQGGWRGALLVDGSLACPHMPTALAQATQGAKDEAVRMPSEGLQQAVEERVPYFLKAKQGPDARGAIRLQCPAAGPSPSVNCARRDRLRPRKPHSSGPPTSVVNLADSRGRAAHPAARPTVQLPKDEWIALPPPEELPAVCGKSDITVPAAAYGDRMVAKFRQDDHYLTAALTASYKPIRSHNEGTGPGRPNPPGRHPRHRRQPGHPRNLALPAHRHPSDGHRLHRRPNAEEAAHRPNRVDGTATTTRRLTNRRNNHTTSRPAPGPRGWP